jgi:hypothetical protein
MIYSKPWKKITVRASEMTQVVEHLSSKHEALIPCHKSQYHKKKEERK